MGQHTGAGDTPVAVGDRGFECRDMRRTGAGHFPTRRIRRRCDGWRPSWACGLLDCSSPCGPACFRESHESRTQRSLSDISAWLDHCRRRASGTDVAWRGRRARCVCLLRYSAGDWHLSVCAWHDPWGRRLPASREDTLGGFGTLELRTEFAPLVQCAARRRRCRIGRKLRSVVLNTEKGPINTSARDHVSKVVIVLHAM